MEKIIQTKEKWGKYYAKLVKKIVKRLNKLLERYESTHANNTEEFSDESDENDFSAGTFEQYIKKDQLYLQMVKIANRFRRYCNQVVICGFNSSGYDQMTTRSELLTYLITFDFYHTANINKHISYFIITFSYHT